MQDMSKMSFRDRFNFVWTPTHGFRRISNFGPPHDFQLFESQKKSLEASGKIINSDGYVVRKETDGD